MANRRTLDTPPMLMLSQGKRPVAIPIWLICARRCCTMMEAQRGSSVRYGGRRYGSNIAPLRRHRGRRDEIRLCGGGDPSSHSSLDLDSHHDADGDVKPSDRLLPILPDIQSWFGDIWPDRPGSGLTYLRPHPLDT